MFGLSTIRIVIYALLAAAFVAMVGLANHYHSSWVEAQGVIAAKDVELNNALATSKACSDATDNLRKLADEKEQTVRKAQEQASIVAKSNQAMANKILSMSPKDANRCIAAQILLEDYKAQVQSGK